MAVRFIHSCLFAALHIILKSICRHDYNSPPQTGKHSLYLHFPLSNVYKKTDFIILWHPTVHKKNLTALTHKNKKRTADIYTRTVLLLPKSTRHWHYCFLLICTQIVPYPYHCVLCHNTLNPALHSQAGESIRYKLRRSMPETHRQWCKIYAPACSFEDICVTLWGQR